MKNKTCTKCKLLKPIDQFYTSNGRVRSWCKICSREKANEWRNNNKEKNTKASRKWRENNKEKVKVDNKFRQIKIKYGITKEDYNNLLESQNNLCPICGLSLNSGSSIGVDHNHKTGKVRGVVHNGCNTFIAYVENHPEQLKNIIKYLQERR